MALGIWGVSDLTLGYVDEIKNVLFGKTIKELEATIQPYVKKAPQSLTSQFPERKKKSEAIVVQKKRKSMETPLYPTCKFKLHA